MYKNKSKDVLNFKSHDTTQFTNGKNLSHTRGIESRICAIRVGTLEDID